MKGIALLAILLLLSACSSEVESKENESHPAVASVETAPITDDDTSGEVAQVSAKESDLLVEWASDAMSRGNHEYDTLLNSKLVVDTSDTEVDRGEVVYFKTPESALEKNPRLPEFYIARVVGLPSETVKITDGQVFINGGKLDTFYAQALSQGLDEEAYFDYVDAHKDSMEVNEESKRAYFSTDMEAVEVGDKEVFVLVDQWWRGTDSKDFGPLPIENIEGTILGYAKE